MGIKKLPLLICLLSYLLTTSSRHNSPVLQIFTDSELLGNEAFDGGGVYNAGIFNGKNVEIRKGNDDPAAFNNGGGVYNVGNFNLTADQDGFVNLSFYALKCNPQKS